jgi:hypothetical protein
MKETTRDITELTEGETVGINCTRDNRFNSARDNKINYIIKISE